MTISIYLPTKNRSRLLGRAISSVMSQTIGDWECIVVDDGSTDDTAKLCRTISKFDRRFKFIRNESSAGACAARNEAIAAAAYPLITGLDDDDCFLPGRLRALLGRYEESLSMVSANDIIVGTRRGSFVTKRPEKSSKAQILTRNSVGNQALMNREKLLSVGCFDISLWGSHDYDLWIKMIMEHGPSICISEPQQIIFADSGHARITTSGDLGHAKSGRAILEKYRDLMGPRQLMSQLGRIHAREGKLTAPLLTALGADASLDSLLEFAQALRAAFRK